MATDFHQRSSVSQAFLASIIRSSDDAIVGKDLNGIIGSWNGGAERIFGYTAGEVIGKPITILIPEHLQGEEAMILARIRRGERIEHYETVRRRKDGHLVDISLTISPIVAADGSIIGASKIARDITDRKRARFAALDCLTTSISIDLELEHIAQRVTNIATSLTGAKYGAFFYNVRRSDTESHLLFTLSGAPREAFKKFGLPRATQVFAPTFHGTSVVRSEDIRTDPRYGNNPPHRGIPEGHLPVVSYLAVPVVSRSGAVIGGLFFAHDQAAQFTQDAEDIAVAIAAQAAASIDNAQLYAAAQEEVRSKELLLNEFKHRMKNTLATVQAIAGQTLRHSMKEERENFVARLHALSHAHEALANDSWHSAPVHDLVQRTLAPLATKRFAAQGPAAWLDGANAAHLTLALHELATNAIKYGALSNDSGSVQVMWSIDGDNLTLDWQETGGPAVQAPGSKGFGSLLIERVMNGHAELEFLKEGVRCTLHFPLKQ